MRLFPALLLAGICLVSCTKKDATPTIDFGPNGGITRRNATSHIQGDPDPTDWTVDGNWNQQEQDLFKNLGLILNATPAPASTPIVFAWPNPVEAGKFVFRLETLKTEVMLSYVMVNAKYQVVIPLQTTSTASRFWGFSFDVSSNDFKKGQLYRLYYVMHDGKALFNKGHGDIKIGL